MTFTGAIGRACLFPLRAIIAFCVALRIHPNLLTLTGVIINGAAGWALATGRFGLAGWIMLVANIFDFIDGKVADRLRLASRFGGFWDSVMDRFSDLFLLIGLIYLYASMGRPDYVLITALALAFSVMTSYTRARAESIIPLCKVGFMERPERIVLFMIGAFTNRMAGVLWVILALSVVTVLGRIYFTWRELRSDGQQAPA
jgi:CDP-diacylglycerol--glycerol-3-phosphate 3-phosphatidyltransferase